MSAFAVTLTDLDGGKQGYRAAVHHQALCHPLPFLLESSGLRQHNLIVRPRGAAVELIQLDDLDRTMLERVGSLAFLRLATSAGNYQAWVAVQGGGADFARRLRRGSLADASASGATRVAGSLNFKRQYAPDFPMVELLQVVPNRTVMPTELDSLGLVAPPAASWVVGGRTRSGRRAKQWPSYELCLQKAPLAYRSDRPDVSRADFTFCLLAIDWGWATDEAAQQLMEKSRKARDNGEPYARLTAQRAAAAIDRRRLNTASDRGRNNLG